jgi:hypothetical protein
VSDPSISPSVKRLPSITASDAKARSLTGRVHHTANHTVYRDVPQQSCRPGQQPAPAYQCSCPPAGESTTTEYRLHISA